MRIELKRYGLKTLDYGLGVFKKVIRTRKGTNEQYEDEEVIGYYGDIGSGLKGLLKHETNSSQAQTIEELRADYEQTKTDIMKEAKKWKLR